MADRAVVAVANDSSQQGEEAEIPVVVAVHVRPLIHDEVVTGCKPCLSVSDREPQVFCGHHTFSFDQVYGGGGQSPSRLYRDCVEPLVQGIFNGYNATVLAYGQTGSGKTYTMGSHFSPPEEPKGVIPDVLGSMFGRIFSETETEFSLRVGFIEIHKEEIHDLLLEGNEQQPNITLREMPNGSMCIAGAREIEVDLSAGASKSLEFVMSILLRGSMSRATSMTMMNARSSRSHAVFSLMLEQRKGGATTSGAGGESQEEDGEGSGADAKETDLSYLCAKMLLVDLAGSERAKRTQATGARLQEGIHINQGLLSLANVIQALVDGHKHVPYRNSKLTRLLQDSLGHNSRTVMVACVSPADSNMEETINTLRYANRARNIKNKPIVNRDPTAAEIVLLRQQLAAARAEIDILRQQMRGSGALDGHSGAVAPRQSGTNSHSAAISEVLGEAASNKQLAQALANQEAAKLAAASGSAAVDGVLEQIQTYQERIIELESQVAMQAKAIKAQNDSSSNDSAAHDAAVAARHPSVTPFSPSTAPSSVGASASSPKRPPLILNKDNPAEAALSKKLSALSVDLQRKQDQINSLNDRKAGGMRQQYDKLVADLLKQQETLKGKHAELHKKLEESNMSHTAEKIKQSKTYKRQVKELNEQIALMKRREHDKQRLEGLMKKSEDMVHRLKSDITRIKNQKSTLEKQIQDLQSDYDTFKKGKAREITDLKKDSQRQESKMRRLAMLNQKQKSVLQRKIQEAEDAKKRLASLKIRAAKRTAATAGPGAGKLPTGSTSSLSGSVSRTGSTPIAAVVGASGADAGTAAKGGNSLGADAGSGLAAGATRDSTGESGAVPGSSLSMMSAGGLPPIAADGSVTDPRAFNEWIKDEIESVSTAHYTRQVLDGIVAKRSDLCKSVLEHDRKISDIDHLPEDQRDQQAATRAGLVASKEVIEKEIEACHENIMGLHAELDAAGKQNDEARQDASAARFAAIKDVAQARSLLAALFQTACKFNDDVQRTKAEITDLEDANEIQKGRANAALEEKEEARTEVDELKKSLKAAEDEATETWMLLAQSEATRKQAELRIAELETIAAASHHGHSSASNSPSPERSSNNSSHRRRSGPRRSETSTGGVVGTFDEASPRGESAVDTSGHRTGGMPPIQEEGGGGKAGPDNDALDAQFQNLMNEININLGNVSRGQTPEPGPRSGGSASGREGSMGGVRSSDDHDAAAPRGDQRFRANPAHLIHPRDAQTAPGSRATSATAKPRPSTADSVPGDFSQSGDTSGGAAGSSHESAPRRRYRVAAPLGGPITTGGDDNGAWDRLSEGRMRTEEPPPGAPVGGGGRSGVPPPPPSPDMHSTQALLHGAAMTQSGSTLHSSPALERHASAGGALPDARHVQHTYPRAASGHSTSMSDTPHASTDGASAHTAHPQTKRQHPSVHAEDEPDSEPTAASSSPQLPPSATPPSSRSGTAAEAAIQADQQHAVTAEQLNTGNEAQIDVSHVQAPPHLSHGRSSPGGTRRATTPSDHPDSWTTNIVSMLSPRHSDMLPPPSNTPRHWWSQHPTQFASPRQPPVRQQDGSTRMRAVPAVDRGIFNAAFNAATTGSEAVSAATSPRPHSHRRHLSAGAAADHPPGSNVLRSPPITRGAAAAAPREGPPHSPTVGGARRSRGTAAGDLDGRQDVRRRSTAPVSAHSHNSSASVEYEPPDPWGVSSLMGAVFSSRPSWASGGSRDKEVGENQIVQLDSRPPDPGPATSLSNSGASVSQPHPRPSSAPTNPQDGDAGGREVPQVVGEAPRVFVSRFRGTASPVGRSAGGGVPSHAVSAPSSQSGSASSSNKGGVGSGSGGVHTGGSTRSSGWMPLMSRRK